MPEYIQLLEKIKYFKEIIENEYRVIEIIKEELLEVKKKFGNPRRTQIIADQYDIEDEDLIKEEEVVVTLTHFGYIKRLSQDTYSTQRRGGKGKSWS